MARVAMRRRGSRARRDGRSRAATRTSSARRSRPRRSPRGGPPCCMRSRSGRAARTLVDVCRWLLASACARAVTLVREDGRLLASAGEEASRRVVFLRTLRASRSSAQQSVETRAFAEAALDGAEVHTTDLQGARLHVIYDGRTSLGIVRLRVLMAVAEIRRGACSKSPCSSRSEEERREASSGAPAEDPLAFDGMRGRAAGRLARRSHARLLPLDLVLRDLDDVVLVTEGPRRRGARTHP